MSVEVKTPSPAQFEHVEFPCGQKTIPTKTKTSEPSKLEVSENIAADPNKVDGAKGGANNQDLIFAQPDKQGQHGKKRRANEFANKSLPPAKRRFSQSGPRGKGKAPVLPTKFLLGGNINDPLNLNSLNDEEISKKLNAQTPQSSPLPTPSHRQQVHVLIPPNVKDPLNLNSAEDGDVTAALLSPKLSNKKKKRHHKKRKSAGDASAAQDDVAESETKQAERPKSLSVIIPDGHDATKNLGSKVSTVIDQIVSPVIPQTSPKWKRKRTASECKSEKSAASAVTTPVEETKALKDTKTLKSPVKTKSKKPLMSQIGATKEKKYRAKDEKFIHGNYDRYYGKRNPGEEVDHRLQCFHKDWFDHRDVLDIGCNIGHVTLSLARDFYPKKIVGIDIDGKLISIARKNIRYYLSHTMTDMKKFPISFPIVHGPMAAPPLPKANDTSFPNNVSFVQANYVLDNDDLLDTVKEEYDCILALSISKWIHLNNGDSGMKRFFKRVFKQLRPGGKFILEPQSWSSYKKKKKLTEAIFKHYQSIRLRPEHFTEYLLSKEVGFITCDLIDLPYNKSKGFQRPIQVYTKPDTSYTTPREVTESRGVTPLMEINCTPHFDCPSYSRNATPGYDHHYSGPGHYTPSSDRATPSYAMWSSNATPRIDHDSRAATPRTPGSRGATPGQDLEPEAPPAGAVNQQAKQAGPKYTFVSGDPRGATPAYACDSRGGTPVHSSNSRSATPVKNLEGNAEDGEDKGKEEVDIKDTANKNLNKDLQQSTCSDANIKEEKAKGEQKDNPAESNTSKESSQQSPKSDSQEVKSGETSTQSSSQEVSSSNSSSQVTTTGESQNQSSQSTSCATESSMEN